MVIAVVAHRRLEHYDCNDEELEQVVDGTKVLDGPEGQRFLISSGHSRV